MNDKNNLESINGLILSKEKDNNNAIKQNISYTPDKTKNNITLFNITELKPISLENINKNETDKNNRLIFKNKIKYGIDENGNPINIKDYYKSINDSVNLNSNTSIFSGITNMTQKLKKPIAYIIKDENNNNILVDLKGNKITTKNKDGDYDFPLQLHVIIKDFDVKYPELRINGERYYKDNDIIEDIKITEEIEKENEKGEENNISEINKTPESISKIKNFNNDNCFGVGESFISNFSNKNELGNLLYKQNTNKNKEENKYFYKYNNINLFGTNKNKDSKKSDISNNSNSQSPDYYNNLLNIKLDNFIGSNKKRQKAKNRSFMGDFLRNNTSNFINLKYKKELSYNHKTNHFFNNNNKIFKSALNINNINNNVETFNNRNRNNIINEKLNTDIDIYYPKLNYIYPKSNKNKNRRNNKQKLLNKLSNLRYINDTQSNINKNSIYKTKSYNYFIIKDNKSITSSKLLNKKDNNNNEGKKILIKKINQKSIFTPNYHKINKKNKKINEIGLDKTKNNSNNSKININNIKNKKIKINCLDISQKIKNIKMDTNEKNFKINKDTNCNYFILSEEANNMIKSYSKKKLKNNKQKLKKIEILNFYSKNKSPNFKTKKLNILSNGNNSNFNNSYFSSNISNKHNFRNLDKLNNKYVGITLSLPNYENKRDKIINNRTNNQININVTPCQVQCESFFKNNNESNPENIINIFNKNRFNYLNKNKYDNKNYISHNN